MNFSSFGFACVILITLISPSTSSLSELCSYAKQMQDVCEPLDLQNITEVSSGCSCVGEQGPRGLRGRPGKDAVVDYDAIYAKMDEKLKVMTLKLSRMEEILSWYKASNGLQYKVFEKEVNYTNAAKMCKRYKASLAAIGVRDPAVRQELISLVKFGVGKSTWIGLDDRKEEGAFVWADGVPLEDEQIDWDQGQPDDFGEAEDCVNFAREYGYKSNDAGCHIKSAFLCERN